MDINMTNYQRSDVELIIEDIQENGLDEAIGITNPENFRKDLEITYPFITSIVFDTSDIRYIGEFIDFLITAEQGLDGRKIQFTSNQLEEIWIDFLGK